MRIAVYSGSFNPLHNGHRAIVEFLTAKLGFDTVYLIVSPKNPLKAGISPDTAEARVKAAAETVKRLGLNAVVDDIELGMPAPQYTIRTLEALKTREPENSFTLVIGADNLAGIRKWKEYRRIISEFGLVVFPRRGYEIGELTCELRKEFEENGLPCRIEAAEAPTVDISSTEIREGIAEGKDMSPFLP